MQSRQDRTVAKDVQHDDQARRRQEQLAHLALLGDTKASDTQKTIQISGHGAEMAERETNAFCVSE
jgi:hypothetical protein